MLTVILKLLQVIAKLKTLYKKVDDVDLLVGGMAERHIDNGLLGPVFRCIVGEQFVRTRAGDKFFYDNANQPGSFTEGILFNCYHVHNSNLINLNLI